MTTCASPVVNLAKMREELQIMMNSLYGVMEQRKQIIQLMAEHPELVTEQTKTLFEQTEERFSKIRRIEREFKKTDLSLGVNGYADIDDIEVLSQEYFSHLKPCCKLLSDYTCGRCKWRAFDTQKARDDHIAFVLSERPVGSDGRRAVN